MSGAAVVNVTARPLLPDGSVWQYSRHLVTGRRVADGTAERDDDDASDPPSAGPSVRQWAHRVVTTDVVVSFEPAANGRDDKRRVDVNDGPTPGRVLSVRSRGTLVVQGAMDHQSFRDLGENNHDWSTRPALKGGKVVEDMTLQYSAPDSAAIPNFVHTEAVEMVHAALDAYASSTSVGAVGRSLAIGTAHRDGEHSVESSC